MRLPLSVLILSSIGIVLANPGLKQNKSNIQLRTSLSMIKKDGRHTSLNADFSISFNENTGEVSVTNLSTQNNQNIKFWKWSFQGAIPSSYSGKTPPVIRYSRAGNYKVILTVSDGNRVSAITKVLNIYDNKPVLSYTSQPVKWTDNLPIGNGNLGAMTFGNISVDSFILNEKTVWTGYANDRDKSGAAHLPSIRTKLFNGEFVDAEADINKYLLGERIMGDGRMAYQPLGRLYVYFNRHSDSMASNYRRSLDITKAIATVNYEIGDVAYRREMFAAYNENVIAVKYSASKDAKLSMRFRLDRDGNYNTCIADVFKKTLVMTEHTGIAANPALGGVKLECMMKLMNKGGSVSKVSNRELLVKDAESVTVYITGTTNRFKENQHKKNVDAIHSATNKTYEAIKSGHIDEYKSYYNRARLNLGYANTFTLQTTEERIEAIKMGRKDPGMINTFFQYGRYLLISSSRPGNIFPANLQGIWVEKLNPAWNADYHTNINLQMNYWPAEVTNLSDVHRPMFTYLDSLVRRGKITAQKVFGCSGAVFGHVSDIWYLTSPTWGYGVTLWPLGAGWSATHLWQHFQFTKDKQWLRSQGYPVMKEYALFLADYLVADPITGKLMSGPSSSPENAFVYDSINRKQAKACMGPAVDHQIITELFRSCIEAAKILQTDDAFAKRLQQKLDSIASQQIGQDGRLPEWNKEYAEAEKGHRHTSHLWGIYPGTIFTQQATPELFAAARKSLDVRVAHGMTDVEWSSAYTINYYARFKEADLALQQIYTHLKTQVHTNLWDNYQGLFQIDGNLASTAGIAEMLLQSHAGYVEVLPALPADWATGNFKGLCARGGFVLDVYWKDAVLQKIEVFSRAGDTLHLVWKDKSITLPAKPGRRYRLILNDGRWVVSDIAVLSANRKILK